jgi:hypothetical protein
MYHFADNIISLCSSENLALKSFHPIFHTDIVMSQTPGYSQTRYGSAMLVTMCYILSIFLASSNLKVYSCFSLCVLWKYPCQQPIYLYTLDNCWWRCLQALSAGSEGTLVRTEYRDMLQIKAWAYQGNQSTEDGTAYYLLVRYFYQKKYWRLTASRYLFCYSSFWREVE